MAEGEFHPLRQLENERVAENSCVALRRGWVSIPASFDVTQDIRFHCGSKRERAQRVSEI